MISSQEGLGKKAFRGYVELFLDPTFRNTKDSNQLSSCAAQDFLLMLNKTFGAGIFRAIIENQYSKYLQEFDMIKNVQPNTDKLNLFTYPPHKNTNVIPEESKN